MGKLADILRAEGVEQVARNLLELQGKKITLRTVKQATHLSDEVLNRLSPSSAVSPFSPERLTQHMASETEQLAYGFNGRVATDSPRSEIAFPTDRVSK